MRVSELINIVYFLFLAVLAALRPLTPARRLGIILTGATAAGLSWFADVTGRFAGPFLSSVFRDWLPAPLFLVAYWTAGLFFTGPNEKLQSALIRLDRKILGIGGSGSPGRVRSRFVAGCLELAYLFCYPLLPMGLAVLYAAGMRHQADALWTVVLPSVYLCYATLPFAQTLPPRVLRNEGPPLMPKTLVTRLNLQILHYGSIQANTFPSAHVATAVSVSLVLLHLAPLAGIAFFGVSICIGFAVVLGRYHYAVDAVLGAAVAVAVFLIYLAFQRG